MRALVVDHDAPAHLSFRDVDEPQPRAHEALVQVSHLSLNPGDLHRLHGAPAGWILGWEAAGVVVRAAADGTGPPTGSRVVALAGGGAWAEHLAVSTATIGVVPPGVDLGEASTLPIAATSALRALRALGPVLAHRVLVTGAGGAVGRFAVQLAARAGAHVLASTNDVRVVAELSDLGADEVLVGDDIARCAPVHGVVESVGGKRLAQAFALLDAGGTVVSVGRASGQVTELAADSLLGDGGAHGRSITTFFLGDGTPGIDQDLAWLCGELERGTLTAAVAQRRPWDSLAQPGTPTSAGKLVLELPDPS